MSIITIYQQWLNQVKRNSSLKVAQDVESVVNLTPGRFTVESGKHLKALGLLFWQKKKEEKCARKTASR